MSEETKKKFPLFEREDFCPLDSHLAYSHFKEWNRKGAKSNKQIFQKYLQSIQLGDIFITDRWEVVPGDYRALGTPRALDTSVLRREISILMDVMCIRRVDANKNRLAIHFHFCTLDSFEKGEPFLFHIGETDILGKVIMKLGHLNVNVDELLTSGYELYRLFGKSILAKKNVFELLDQKYCLAYKIKDS